MSEKCRISEYDGSYKCWTHLKFWGAIRDYDPCLNSLQAEIERLSKENKILSLKNSGTLANNLCPDHRDKQAGKPCLACEIESLRACLERISHHKHCDARTADINDLKIGYWVAANESEKDFIIMGIAAGHRCCAAIAAKGLEEK